MLRFLWITLALINILSLSSTAQAAVIFSLRGDSLTPRYAAGGKSYQHYLAAANLANPGAVEALGHASVIGGSAVNLIGLNDTRAIIYTGGANWPSGTDVFSVLVRVVPNWTGNPAGVRRLIMVGQISAPAYAGGLLLEVQTDGTIYAIARGRHDSGAAIFAFTTSSTFSFTSGTATDIMIVSDGARVYMSQDGVEKHDAALQNTDQELSSIVAGGIRIGPYPWDGHYNEVVIWNSAEPHEYTARTAFITVDDFDGTTNTDPGVANVVSGTSYTIAGVAKLGTLVSPALTDVKIGVAGAGGLGTYDGSDRWTDPGESNVSDGIEYKANSTSNNKTGTRLTVTNILSGATMSGAARSAVLTAQ